jgi:hypothetical protein
MGNTMGLCSYLDKALERSDLDKALEHTLAWIERQHLASEDNTGKCHKEQDESSLKNPENPDKCHKERDASRRRTLLLALMDVLTGSTH